MWQPFPRNVFSNATVPRNLSLIVSLVTLFMLLSPSDLTNAWINLLRSPVILRMAFLSDSVRSPLACSSINFRIRPSSSVAGNCPLENAWIRSISSAIALKTSSTICLLSMPLICSSRRDLNLSFHNLTYSSLSCSRGL